MIDHCATGVAVEQRSSALAPPGKRFARRFGWLLLALLCLMLAWRLALLSDWRLTVRNVLTTWDRITCVTQDLLVWCVLFAICTRLKPTTRMSWCVVVACNVVLLLQMIDVRCKLVFLQPLALSNALFAFSHASSLLSSVQIFLGKTYWAGVLASLLLLNGVAAVTVWRRSNRARRFQRATQTATTGELPTGDVTTGDVTTGDVPTGSLTTAGVAIEDVTDSTRSWTATRTKWTAAGVVVFTVASVATGPLPYQVNANPLTASMIDLLRQPFAPVTPDGVSFDQPVYAFCGDFGEPGSADAASDRASSPAQRGRSVVIYVVESLRYEDRWEPGSPDDPIPFLRSLSSMGPISTRCYAQVANSTKAMFSILTGRYAATGMEVVESQLSSIEGIVSALRRVGYRTVFASTQYLAYQNVRHQYRAMGFDTVLGAAEIIQIARAAGYEPYINGYGCDDRALLHGVVDQLVGDEPFLLVVYNCSTHHPYDFPGADATGLDRVRYYRALRFTDSVLRKFTVQLEARMTRGRPMRERPLFVVVGDHGEPFMYGNTRARGCSLSDQELLVPLFIADPATPRDTVDVSHARQIDIVPTILDLIGVEVPPLSVQGRSLLRAGPPLTVYMSSWGACHLLALIEDQTKYFWDVPGDRMWEYSMDDEPEDRTARDVDPLIKESVSARLLAFERYTESVFRAQINR